MLKLQGTITAMVTPFDANDNVDYGALRAFVDWQCENGVEGICAVGTSGESPTLSHEEHHKVIEKTIEFAAGRVKIVAGTGANSTAEAVSPAPNQALRMLTAEEARALPLPPFSMTMATAISGSSKGAKQTNTPLATVSPVWAEPVLAPALTTQDWK